MDSEPYRWDFFIAHAGADKAAAESLYDLLVRESRVYLGSKCLNCGDDWTIELPAAQRASFITVVLVSSNTGKAYYEREEIAAAIALAREDENKHRVVPVYLDREAASNDVVPYGLRLRHGIQMEGGFTVSDCARKLLLSLRRLRSNPRPGGIPDSPILHPGASVHSTDGILHQPPAGWVSPVRRNPWRYKVAAFDLDGTLLRGDRFDFSWEAVWQYLRFGEGIQNELKREYGRRIDDDPSKASRIKAYRDWCDKACTAFKRRELTRKQLRDICQSLSLTRNCREALIELREQAVVVAIISGGINTFLEDTFPDFRKFVDFVFINELVFATSGALTGVHATAYDFQGKAEALDLVCERVGCSPEEEAVFIGDHFNDASIMRKVAKAIAYPPRDVLTHDASTELITEDDLRAVLPCIFCQ